VYCCCLRTLHPVQWVQPLSRLYNPRITKVQVTVEGIPKQQYAQGMLPYQHWDEIVQGFACKDSSTDMSTYYQNRYGLWLNFRSSDDQKLHGSGGRVENASEGVKLQLDKTAESAGPLPYDRRATKHRQWTANICDGDGACFILRSHMLTASDIVHS